MPRSPQAHRRVTVECMLPAPAPNAIAAAAETEWIRASQRALDFEKHYGASHAIVYGVIPAAVLLIVTGTTLVGIAVSKEDWPQFGAALVVIVGGVAAAFVGPSGPAGDTHSFTRLQDLLDLTAGNLITHLRKLEDAGYLTSETTGNGRASGTSLALTSDGRAALTRYTEALRGPRALALALPPRDRSGRSCRRSNTATSGPSDACASPAPSS